MTRKIWNTASDLVVAHEGKYVDHPKDPGGATKFGVTLRTLSAERGYTVTKQEVKDLTRSEAVLIFKRRYWDVVWGDKLPAGIDYCVFDYAINSGPAQAVRELQRVVGAPVDGVIGTQTLMLVREAAKNDELEVILDLCTRRMVFMKSLKTWGTFGLGWTRRVMGRTAGAQLTDNGVVDYATRIALDDHEFEMPKAIGSYEGEEVAKANPGDVAVTKTNKGQAGILTASAGGATGVLTLAEKLQGFTGVSDIITYAVVALVCVGAGWMIYETIKDAKEERGVAL